MAEGETNLKITFFCFMITFVIMYYSTRIWTRKFPNASQAFVLFELFRLRQIINNLIIFWNHKISPEENKNKIYG